jgi:hypothetical protein
VQGERTQYARRGLIKHEWSKEKEAVARKELKEQLNGIHPAEFLVSEFIARNKKLALEGKLFISMPRNPTKAENEMYSPLLERFFKPIAGEKWNYVINLDKKRVREILGIT